MPDAKVVRWICDKFVDLATELDERGRRRWAAIEARSLGRGGIAAVAEATASGLEVHAWLDEKTYHKGMKVSDKELSECIIIRNNFHGDWNYEIHPRKTA